MIFYEAPHKLPTTLRDFLDTFGADRSMTVCREPVSYTHLDVYKRQVLDRTKEPGAYAEPLHLDVLSAFAEAKRCLLYTSRCV